MHCGGRSLLFVLVLAGCGRVLAIGDDAGAEDSGATDGRHDPEAGDPTPDADTDADANPPPLVAGRTWSSPNGASWTAVDGGIVIRAFGDDANHPIIAPEPPLPIPAENYTVEATILSPAAVASTKEFGIVARGQPDGGPRIVFGVDYGMSGKPFLGVIEPPNWNPSSVALGAVNVVAANTRYQMKVSVVGASVSAKTWPSSATEPSEWQVATIATWTTGRIVGFYTYFVNGAVLERLSVTVP